MQETMKFYHNRPRETKNQTIYIWNPMTTGFTLLCNVDLRHQYGISVTKMQTSLFGKMSLFARGDSCVNSHATHVVALSVLYMHSVQCNLANSADFF